MTEQELLNAVRAVPEDTLATLFEAFADVQKERWITSNTPEARETVYAHYSGARSFVSFISQKRAELRKVLTQPQQTKVP